MSLASADRAHVVKFLIESLSEELPERSEEEWLDEAERRLADIDAGRVELTPDEEVFPEDDPAHPTRR